MKKLIIPMALVIALLLTGCGLSEQIAAVREEYIDPAIERADSGDLSVQDDGTDALRAGPNVSTDRSLLGDAPVYEAVFERAQSGYMSSLVTGRGGTLLPIGGGLATSEGEIVLDPVLVSVTPARFVTDGVEYQTQIYILENSDGMFAACSAYGEWTTGFDYTEIIAFEPGVLCISDAEQNLAVCYNNEGEILFDTSQLSSRYELMSGTVSSLAQYGSGYMLCQFTNGQYGFMGMDGQFLNRYTGGVSYFDEARPFTNGRAAVCSNGSWGYLDAEGNFIIERQYEDATSFAGNNAAVLSGGNWSIIDSTGAVRLELGAVSSVEVTPSYILADGSYYTVNDYTEAVFYGYTGVPCEEGFWVRGANGVRVFRSDGTQVYFSGAAELLDISGGLYLVELADGSTAAMDEYSRVAAADVDSLVTDGLTGVCYALTQDGQLYDSSGVLMAENCAGTVLNTYVLCEDGPMTGWKAASGAGEWIICLIDNTSD